MNTLTELRTLTITAKGQIAIPKDVRNREGFREGDKVVLMAYEDHIEIRPVKNLERALDISKPGVQTAIMSEKSLAREWLTPKEDEAWKDL